MSFMSILCREKKKKIKQICSLLGCGLWFFIWAFLSEHKIKKRFCVPAELPTILLKWRKCPSLWILKNSLPHPSSLGCFYCSFLPLCIQSSTVVPWIVVSPSVVAPSGRYAVSGSLIVVSIVNVVLPTSLVVWLFHGFKNPYSSYLYGLLNPYNSYRLLNPYVFF